MHFEALKDFEDSYEIEVDSPHRIRKIGTNRFVSTSVNSVHGYVQINLNGRPYLLHRILAKHFIISIQNYSFTVSFFVAVFFSAGFASALASAFSAAVLIFVISTFVYGCLCPWVLL